jgi:hypothetical protein
VVASTLGNLASTELSGHFSESVVESFFWVVSLGVQKAPSGLAVIFDTIPKGRGGIHMVLIGMQRRAF